MSGDGGLGEKLADRAIHSGLRAWWENTDENQKVAITGLGVAAAIGPLGQGILASVGMLFSKAALPSSEQLQAVYWLFVITLPVAIGVALFVFLAGRVGVPVILIWVGPLTLAAGAAMASTPAPLALGDLYCYASYEGGLQVEYEDECRTFDTLGFTTRARPLVGSPSGGAQIWQWAVLYTADARGSAMVLASIIAAASGGYLVRRAVFQE